MNGKTVTINGLTTTATAPVVENANATAATLTVNNSSANTFAGVLRDGTGGGALTLTKTGAGTLTLSGTNAYTGATNINGGAISVTANANLGSTAPAAGITFSGGTLLIGGSSSSFSTSRAITLNGSGTLDSGAVSNTMTFMTGSTVTNGANLLTLQGSGAGSLADVIGNGSGGVTKSGTGSWTLSGNNSYTGLTTISQGVLNIQHGNALGSISNGTSITNGAALELQGGITTAAEALTLNGTGISSNGALRSISGANTYGGVITLASNSSIGVDANSLGITQGITDGASTFSLTKVGAGTLSLNGANTYDGATTISNGTLALGASGTIATSPTISVASGATFDLTAKSGRLRPGHWANVKRSRLSYACRRSISFRGNVVDHCSKYLHHVGHAGRRRPYAGIWG